MPDSQSPDFFSPISPNQDITPPGQSGGVTLQSNGDTCISGDVVGRDKVTITHAENVFVDGVVAAESISKDIQKLIRKSHLVLDGIIDKFGDDLTLERATIHGDLDRKFAGNKLLIFKGEAGAGKSAYAKSIVSGFREEANYSVLAFKADTFAKESVEEALHYLELNNSLPDILHQLGQEQQVIVLIDSLEKLLEVETYEALKEFLRICRQVNNTKIIVTCRNFAYQQLIFHLHYDFPKYDFLDVPFLDDAELAKIEARFPFLTSLFAKKSLRQILRRPFYLNLVILHSEAFKNNEILSEKEFRVLIWNEVVAKHDIKRGNLFEKIALQRAVSMNLYTRIAEADPCVIKQLYGDGVIFVEDMLGDAYCPAHDIYEDIALIRFVERNFQEKDNTLDFFNKLGGKEPAKRRAFRLWLNDQLIEVTTRLTLFISEIFGQVEIEQYWQDEVAIALLQSEYCQNFMNANRELFSRNSYALLLRFVQLLRTACQEPDEHLAQASQDDEQGNVFQWQYLKPVGPGWHTLLQYISEYLDDLREHWPLALKLVTKDWSKKLGVDLELPPEAHAVGKIILPILDAAKDDNSSRRNRTYSDEDVDDALELLFSLCSILKDEVGSLIEAADVFEARSSSDYRLRDFYASVIKFVLSGLHSREVCRELPDLVCKVAIGHWLEHSSPTDRHPFRHSARIDVGEDYGLFDSSHLEYFPAGIYKTPVRFLLYSHPAKALQLIVTVLNRATDAYARSARGKNSNVVEVKVCHEDGSCTTQKGNIVLWAMYRGAVETTPYLLQSILMSLESWLFELCQVKDEGAFKLIEYTFNYLLKTSTTVATTAVLASVAQAYPKRIGKLAFPILRVKEFYIWDIARLVGDQLAPAPMDHRIAFAQAERFRSNQLLHRKSMLEHLVTKLQVEGYWNEINSIIDVFRLTLQQDDTRWKLVLNRMDFRKFEIDESVEPPDKNQVAMKPKIDADLVEIVDESQKDWALKNEVVSAANWAIQVYTEKAGVDKSLDTWQAKYRILHKLTVSDNDSLGHLGDPTHLAAVGIKLFHAQLPEEELHWCVDVILSALEDRIIRTIKRDPYYKVVFIEPAIEIAPSILSLGLDDERRRSAKEIVFRSALHLVSHEMEYPFESMRNSLWRVDEVFAHSCLAGLIEYSVLHRQRGRYYSPSEEGNKRQRKLLEEEEWLVARVCDNKIELQLNDLSFDTHSHWYLGFAAQIVPLDTCNDQYRFFIKQVFKLLFRVLSEKDKGKRYDGTEYLETTRHFQEYLAQFLLSQPKQFSQDLFSEILDCIFANEGKRVDHEAHDFVKDIIEAIIVEEDKLKSGGLWNLWEVLRSKIQSSQKQHFISYLFLAMPWWNSGAEDWAPLEDKKLYFRTLIIELGCYDIKSVVKLLSGIGAARLLPDGLIWLQSVLNKLPSPQQELNDSGTFYYCEKLVQRVYYRHLKGIKAEAELRQSLLYLLDIMINLGSSLSFMIRERLISI